MMNDDEWCLRILLCVSYIIVINGKTHGDDIAASGIATFILDLQKEHLYRKKRQAGADFVHGKEVLSFSHDRMR